MKIGSPAQGQSQQPMNIQVAPGSSQPLQSNPPVVSYPEIVNTGEEVVGADPPPVITRAPVATGTDPLGQVAQQHGEALGRVGIIVGD